MKARALEFRRGRDLNARDLALLRQLRDDDPWATLAVLTRRLAERRGVSTSKDTVWRALGRMGIKYHRRGHEPLAPRRRVPVAKPYAPEPDRVSPSPPDRRAYPTDLTDLEWELLEPLVPKCKPGGRPETYPKRELVNAMLYVLRNGNAWRALPHDLPPWKTVYYYFRRWCKSGLWQQINDQLRTQARRRAGRGLAPSAAIIDSQSAHTTEKGGLAVGTATSA